jgi:hypothetical protein
MDELWHRTGCAAVSLSMIFFSPFSFSIASPFSRRFDCDPVLLPSSGTLHRRPRPLAGQGL